jgi:hypothetical protein
MLLIAVRTICTSLPTTMNFVDQHLPIKTFKYIPIAVILQPLITNCYRKAAQGS